MSESVPGAEKPRPQNIHEAGYEPSLEDIDPATVQPSIQTFAPHLERQELFIHTFKCQACSLEFTIFSWWPDRHTVVNTACPECRRVTQKSHCMSSVADNPAQCFGEGPEIFHYSPVGPDPQLRADCSLFTGLPLEHDSTGSAFA
jgi:hypothetical protein